MLLRLGERAQPRGHGARLVELAELHERLDQVRGDRERSGLVDALALACAPRPLEPLGGARRLVREQRREPERARRLEHLPAVAARLGLARAPAPPTAPPLPRARAPRRAARGSAGRSA